MVVTNVQDYIAAGQFRGGEQLVEAQKHRASGHHSRFHGADLQGRAGRRDARQQLYRQRLHQQSRTDLVRETRFVQKLCAARRRCDRPRVHAMLLRIQALLLPIKTLVLSGH
jgi:hypothetical protein